jgi:SAM-dependent methyltransferase
MSDHPLFAAAYDAVMARSEAKGLAARRDLLLAPARGRVLEIGAGTGLNLSHYRSDRIGSIVALEPDGAMRSRLLVRTPPESVPFEVHEAAIDDAVFGDGQFDTIVSTLVLCSVPDLDRAARAISRWLAPSGRLLFLDHVRAVGLRGTLQRAAAPLWVKLAAGCHLDRDPIGALRRAGLAVTDCERFPMPAAGVLFSSCVQGVARRHPVTLDGDDPEGAP